MKGHSKIILTNVNTGEEQVFENDNMVTNALSKYLASIGFGGESCLSSRYTYDYPLWQELLGGIMLFEDNLEEDADNVIVPANNKMVGNSAFGLSYAGVVSEMGSYNQSESGVQEDGSIKLVYDFSTAQANGTIRSVALSSRAGGFIGAGNATSAKNEFGNTITINERQFAGLFDSIYNTSNYFKNYIVKEGNTVAAFEKYCMFVDYENNCIYYIRPNSLFYSSGYSSEHFSNTRCLKIDKYKLGLSAISVTGRIRIEELLESYDVALPDDFITWMGSSFYKNNLFSVQTSGKNVYILFAGRTNYMQANDSMYVIKISDVDNAPKATLFKMRNNCGENIYNICFGVTSDEYIIVKAYTRVKLFKIKLSDSTDVTEIDTYTYGTSYGGSEMYMINDRIYLTDGNQMLSVVDTKANKSYKLNGKARVSGRVIPVVGNPLLAIRKDSNSSAYETLYVVKNCNYLATINNLMTPVEKTADTTMKVIYTLTF